MSIFHISVYVALFIIQDAADFNFDADPRSFLGGSMNMNEKESNNSSQVLTIYFLYLIIIHLSHNLELANVPKYFDLND